MRPQPQAAREAPAGPLLLFLPTVSWEALPHPCSDSRLAVWPERGLEECGDVVTKAQGIHQGHTLGGSQALFLGHLPWGAASVGYRTGDTVHPEGHKGETLGKGGRPGLIRRS